MTYRGEVLQPGASNPDDTGELARERREHDDAVDAYHAARSRGRWLGTDGVSADFHQHDVQPGAYDLPPGMTARERWEAGAANPWQTTHPPCVDCGATLTYVGHVDDIPNQPRCRGRCRRPLPFTADAHTPPKP